VKFNQTSRAFGNDPRVDVMEFQNVMEFRSNGLLKAVRKGVKFFAFVCSYFLLKAI
jgi:hypothetical protein